MLRSHLLIALPMALLAGACTQNFDERAHAALPVEQRLPIEVTTDVALIDIETDANGRLTYEAQRKAAGVFAAYKRDGAGALEIQIGRGGRLGAEAEGQLRDLAAVHGIPRNQIRLANYVPEPGDTASVRLAFARYVASVPACDNIDWSQNLSMTWDNTVYPSFGCAVQQNVAAMVGDPRDLVRMQAMGPGSADRRGTIMDKFEKGEATAAARESGGSGKVSDASSGTERQ